VHILLGPLLEGKGEEIGEAGSPGMASRIVVIGIGNEFRGDDAAGIVVARALQKGPLPSHVSVVEAGLAGPSLLNIWMGADLAIVVDAVTVERDGEDTALRPGSVMEINVSDVLLGSASFCSDRASSHGFGLREALQLASVLGYPYMPHRLRVIGICADLANLHITNGGLTPAVGRGCAEAVKEIRKTICLHL
jgi:hydrogenase maturation protease